MDRKKLKSNKFNLDIDKCLNYEFIERLIKQNIVYKSYKIYLSASGTGLHFEITLLFECSVSELFEFREILGDDPLRLAYSKIDFEKGWNYDLLFTRKKINGKWYERKLIKEVSI